MAVSFHLTELRLNEGTIIEPPLDGMTVFTGPNNSGKSALLRELVAAIHHHPHGNGQQAHWVNSIQIQQSGDGEDLLAWLKERGREPRFNHSSGRSFIPGLSDHDQPGMDIDQFLSAWVNGLVNSISYLLVNDQWTEQRLGNQTDSHVWDQSRPPSHPSQLLWEDKEAHLKFSDLFERAFGQPIAINRYTPQIRLQIGSTGMEDTAPPAGPQLREAYAALPLLQEQGDGMRAFTNILLHTLVRPAPIIVIDEPEAFLHPPQARLLGRYLALHTPSPCQVFVATHSVDFLNGVLEGNALLRKASPKDLSLARISRTDNEISAKTLNAESVRDILDTPLLRHSNIVSGLFHDGVILCEAEGDCHFYAATIDALRTSGQHENVTLLHVNGKSRLADAAHKLRACGIPTAITADLDYLNDEGKLKEALMLLGGNWQDIEADMDCLRKQVSSSVTARPAAEVKKEIATIIGNARGRETLSKFQMEQITELLKTADGWKSLKVAGISALTGDAHGAAKRVLEYLARLGVFLVPVGELECWVREVPSGRKSAWLTRVFEEGHHERPSAELRDFTNATITYLSAV
ncbi:ATP-dependent endonuclease [Streptomyces sp. NPDC012389]|uniref:ATP-dependent nuclease n=1 Tax=Streptomyces sp. NPDC012389 TaxID=3364830 RepID=UPI0036E3C34E